MQVTDMGHGWLGPHRFHAFGLLSRILISRGPHILAVMFILWLLSSLIEQNAAAAVLLW